MARNEEIVGVFFGEQHVFDNGEDNRTIIGQIGDEITSFSTTTIKGDAAKGELVRGIKYRFYGHYINHWKHGRQFVFNSHVVLEPAGRDGVIAYLLQIDGIGHATAKLLWEKYEDKAVEMLRTNPNQVSRDIPRLKLDVATEASSYLATHQEIERCKIDLMNILAGKGFPKRLIHSLIGDYGNKAAERIKKNPYLLMRYGGVGFARADKLYLENGGRPNSMKRQALSIWNALYKDTSGSTWLPAQFGIDSLRKALGGAEPNPRKALTLAIRGKRITGRRDANGNPWIATSGNATAEYNAIQSLLMAKTSTAPLRWPDIDAIEGLEDPDAEDEEGRFHQRIELKKATREHVGVLAGSPGTGKTYTAAKLIRAILDTGLAGHDQIKACAPTGKAAVRVTTNLERNGLRGLRATTIHSLLEVTSAGEDGFGFARHNGNPIECQYLLVDETSMLDTALFASLMDAVPDGCHVLFVGDPNQLSPVGSGAPLRDMIASGVIPTGTLSRIRRNAGRVVKACAELRDTGKFSVSERYDLPQENLICLEKTTPKDQLECLVKLVESVKHGKNYDPVMDVQVLVAVNRKSELGRREVNARLQELLNPTGERAPGNPFRVGDKIINLKNGRFPVDEYRHASLNDPLEPDGEGRVYVANGEQAIVLEVTPAMTVAKLTDPDRAIRIPRGQQQSNSDNEEEAADTGCSWDLGYAISGHKSQGSEWPIVIIMIDDSGGAKWVCNKEWMFTTISRVRVCGALIGKFRTALSFCTSTGLWKRKTFFKEDLLAELKLLEEQREKEPVNG